MDLVNTSCYQPGDTDYISNVYVVHHYETLSKVSMSFKVGCDTTQVIFVVRNTKLSDTYLIN